MAQVPTVGDRMTRLWENHKLEAAAEVIVKRLGDYSLGKTISRLTR